MVCKRWRRGRFDAVLHHPSPYLHSFLVSRPSRHILELVQGRPLETDGSLYIRRSPELASHSFGIVASASKPFLLSTPLVVGIVVAYIQALADVENETERIRHQWRYTASPRTHLGFCSLSLTKGKRMDLSTRNIYHSKLAEAS